MITAHGQELSSEFIDTLLVSIVDEVPDRQWVLIRKNHDQVIAGIKHLIDKDCFGEQIELVLSSDYIYFKKREKEPPRVKVAKPVSNFSEQFWRQQDVLMVKQEKEKIDKEKRKDELKYKKQKRGSKR